MSEKDDIAIPAEIAALIPDAVTSGEVSDTAKAVVKEIAKEQDNNQTRADRMVEEMQKIPTAKVAINGIFKHPSDFTAEEWDIIVMGLKAHLPLSSIAMKVHCERHFLAKKIAETEEVAQVVIDAKEGVIDETEYQLIKNVRAGSMSAIIYLLDHLGQHRGYGEQQQTKEGNEDVNIVFGEIPQAEIQEAQNLIAAANQKVTPTLAHELEGIEIPKAATAQQIAAGEELVKAIEKANQPKPVDIPPPVVSQPPYQQQPTNTGNGMSDEQFELLQNAFGEGGDSPFANF